MGVHPIPDMQAEIITPSVFDYLDYRRFLEDWFSARRIADPKFSVRAFTRKAGLPISNSSFFSKVIAGKRNLTLDLRFKLVKALRLPHSETRYFELLVQFNQSKDAGSKQHFYGELARFRRSKARIIGKEGFEYYSRWHYSIVRAFFGLDQRESNPAAIAEKVFPRLDVKEVEDAVRLLLGLGLITRTANGYALKDRHIATERENKDFVGKVRITAMLDLARDVFNHVPAADREYSTLTMFISRQGYQAVQDRLKAFRQEVKSIVEQDASEDRIYTLNFQLFPNNHLPEWGARPGGRA
jgi:uncharacterized protein (TIGR02147 family)